MFDYDLEKDVFFFKEERYFRRVCVLAFNMDRKLWHHILLRLHQNCFPRKMLSSPPACLSASPQALLSLLKMQIMHPPTAHNNRELFLTKKKIDERINLFSFCYKSRFVLLLPWKILKDSKWNFARLLHLALNWKWRPFCKTKKP